MGGSGVLAGRVEVVLEGPTDDVGAVLAALEGPDTPGRVTAVDVRDEPDQGEHAFTIG